MLKKDFHKLFFFISEKQSHIQLLVWNKWDTMSFKAFKESMVGFYFENHETIPHLHAILDI